MLLLLVMIGAVVGYDRSVNYWEAFEPGKLLQRLDALTLEPGQLPAVANEAVALTQPLPTAQPKLDEDVYEDGAEDTDTDIEADAGADVETETAGDGGVDDADIDTDIIDHVTADDEVELAGDLESAEAHSGENYERSYEQFVRQYFDRVPDQEDEDEYDNEEQQQLDASIETQAEASSNVHKLNKKSGKKPKTSSKSTSHEKHKRERDGERCRRVHRKGQLCKICREPRHNEVSETCSYSHAEEPEQYAYGSGSQYKRYRDKSPRKHTREAEEEEAEEEKEQPAKRPQRSERHTTILLPPSNKNRTNNSSSTSSISNSIAGSDSSLCVRRQQGKSVCYDCKDSGGKRMTRCYDAAVKKHSRKSSAKPGKPRTRESQQSEQEQRIYKRTISYSYARDSSSPDDHDENLEQHEPLRLSTSTASTTTAAAAASAAVARNGTQVTPRPTGRKLARVVRRRVALPTPIPIPYRT